MKTTACEVTSCGMRGYVYDVDFLDDEQKIQIGKAFYRQLKDDIIDKDELISTDFLAFTEALIQEKCEHISIPAEISKTGESGIFHFSEIIEIEWILEDLDLFDFSIQNPLEDMLDMINDIVDQPDCKNHTQMPRCEIEKLADEEMFADIN